MHPQSSSRKGGTSSQFKKVEGAIPMHSVISLPGAAREDWCEKHQKGWARQWASRKPTIDWSLPVEKKKKYRRITGSLVDVDHVLSNEKKIVETDICPKVLLQTQMSTLLAYKPNKFCQVIYAKQNTEA